MAIVSLVLAVLLAAGGDPATRPTSTSATQAASTVTDQEFNRLVAELNDPRFAVREAATRRLCRLEASFLPRLVERYRTAVGEEAKHRLRYVTETIFYQQELAGRCGFIGIRLPQQAVPDIVDPTEGRRCYGIYVSEVIDGMPAERAGLRNGDIMIRLNDQPLPKDPSTQRFISIIEQTPPGTPVRLRLLRPGQSSRTVTLQPAADEPSTLLGLKVSGPPITAPGGIRVVQVAPQSAAEDAGLKPNDIVTAVNGKEITNPLDGTGILARALQSAGLAAPVTLKVQSCEDITVEVVVGRRPIEYVNKPEHRLEIQASFARWWRKQGGQWQPLPDNSRTFLYVSPGSDSPQREKNAIIP